jgi:hypothetical protein
MSGKKPSYEYCRPVLGATSWRLNMSVLSQFSDTGAIEYGAPAAHHLAVVGANLRCMKRFPFTSSAHPPTSRFLCQYATELLCTLRISLKAWITSGRRRTSTSILLRCLSIPYWWQALSQVTVKQRLVRIATYQYTRASPPILNSMSFKAGVDARCLCSSSTRNAQSENTYHFHPTITIQLHARQSFFGLLAQLRLQQLTVAMPKVAMPKVERPKQSS